MRTQDNPHLPSDFIERMQANYDPSMLQAYLNGEFINLTTGQVYDRFTRENNVTNVKPEIGLEPLRVGHGFQHWQHERSDRHCTKSKIVNI